MSRPVWRVIRVSGLLVPGFTKRFDLERGTGTTSYAGIPVGRFAIEQGADGTTRLRYLRWPVVDVLKRGPEVPDGDDPPRAAARADALHSINASGRQPIDATGNVRLPGGRLVPFCHFRLTRAAV